MGLDFRYGTDVSFVNSTALSTDRVRLGTLGLVEAADFGTFSSAGIVLDDPDSTFEMQGLRPFWVDETTATHRRIFTGFLADRKYRRDPERSKIVDGARVMDATLLDLNAIFKLRVLRSNTAQRPAEDVGARVAWLLTQMSPTIYDNGHVDTSLGRNMGKTDYRGMFPEDVLVDCSGGTARNFFAYWDPAAPSGQRISLFFNDASYAGYTASLRLTNNRADVDNTVTFFANAELTRDPVTTYSGVYYIYKGGRVYRQNLTTAANYIPRDLTVESGVTATRSVAVERAEAILDDRTNEHDNLTITARLPASKVNLALPGHAMDVKFNHFPDYVGWMTLRILRRTVQQVIDDPSQYTVIYECAVPSFSTGGPAAQPPNDNPFQPDCTALTFSNVHDQTTDAGLTAWGDDGGTAWLDDIVDGTTYDLEWRFVNGTRDNPANLEYSQKIHFVQSAPTNHNPALVGWLPNATNTGSGDTLTPGGVQDTGAVQTATGTWTYDEATAIANGWNPGDPIWFFGRGGWSPGTGSGGTASLTMTPQGFDADCNEPEPGQPIPPENAGTGNGTTRCYVTNYPYLAGSLRVTVNGISVVVEETNPETGAWCLSFPPPAGAVINVAYQAASPEGTGGTNPTAPPGGYIQTFPVSTNKGDLIASDGSNWQVHSGGSNYQVLTRDTAFPLGVKWAEPSNVSASVSFGSNSNDVSGTSAAGASLLSARTDHTHQGIRTVTASSSNTMDRPALNLRAGTGIAFGLTDTDSNGQFDTLTVISTVSGGGGGGGGSTDAILGQTSQGGARISGLQGSPDINVGAANDDEFDTTDTSDPMTGWTTMGTPTAHDINSTVKSHYYARKAAAAGNNCVGIYKTSPSMPFTVTAKITDAYLRADFNKAALFVGESTPGKLEAIAFGWNSSATRVEVDAFTNPTTFGSQPVSPILVGGSPLYVRCFVHSSTDIDWFYSEGGLIWRRAILGRNPGFTIASVGLMVASENATYPGEAVFDWIRFT